jgi:hypothetical protein
MLSAGASFIGLSAKHARAVADILPSELQKMIDEAVEEIRARNQRTPSVNYNP